MALTNFNALTDEQLTAWATETWSVARNMSFVDRFVGSGNDAMIQRISELTPTKKGARAVLTLVQDLTGDGVAGDNTLENNEESMSSDDVVITLDQLRNGVRHKGRMADQTSVVKFREHGRDKLGYWLADRKDQMAFLMLSGVPFTKTNNGGTRTGSALPLLDFAPASNVAPSTNRHLRWDVDTVNTLKAGDTSAVAATDVPSWEMLVKAKSYCKEHYIKPLRGERGLEVYNVFMHPRALAALKTDSDFLAAMRDALPRSEANPLFKGFDVIYVDGLAIYEYRHVYNTTGTATKWGGGSTVEGSRTLICGAQALGLAEIGSPEWVEEGYDYQNQQGISYGQIFGLVKPKFYSNIDAAEEDFGVLCLDHAI